MMYKESHMGYSELSKGCRQIICKRSELLLLSVLSSFSCFEYWIGYILLRNNTKNQHGYVINLVGG